MAVTGDVTYTATFTETVNKYTVKFVNEDGTELQSSKVAYGETPAYTGETPTKAGDAQYSYTFAGWDKEIAAVTGDAIYTATFTQTVNEYTITWKNADGTVLETDENVEYGTMPEYNGATPTKAADAQYTYTFEKWSPEVSAVTDNVTYTATYTGTVNTYTVTWKNADGTVLETDASVPYGAMPTYNGTTPTKEADAQYTYNFAGWDKKVTTVIGDATYTAVFESTVNTYTVVWKHEDGTVLETDENVPYGEIPTFDGEEPTKEQTDTTVYAFSGWDPEVKAVEGNAEYTAVFTESTRLYTVQWLDEDGTKLAKDQTGVTFDAELTFPCEELPTKEGNAQYSYTFNDWARSVDGDVITMRATYTQTVNEYTVTWIVNGEIVETDANVPYGTVPTYDGQAPKKAATAQYTYTFSGWDKPLDPITGNTSFEAQFSEALNAYLVTWKDYDGTVLYSSNVDYGDVPSYSGENPTREGTAEFSYTFSGWTPEVVAVTGEATYTATYTAARNSYAITWVDDDGTVIDTTSVEYGAVPTHDDLTKAATAEYTYTFTGWTPEIVAVTREATYTATYAAAKNSYTITWENDDGSVIDTTTVEYGVIPTHADPAKAATAEYTYTFTGWSPELAEVTRNATYTATYDAVKNTYAVTVSAEHGSVELSNVTDGMAEYGAEVTFTATSESEDYAFVNWTNADGEVVSEDNPYVLTITGPVSLKANFGLTFDPVAKIGDRYFRTLTDAATAAQSGDVIVLLKSVEQTEDITIPAGATLLLPYAAGEETVNAADADHPYANQTLGALSYQITPVGQNVTYKLTLNGAKLSLPDGAKLVVGGTLSGYQPIGGGTFGAHSEIEMLSGASIDVSEGAILSTCGYITGGTVNASGTVYEPFIMTDYQGGSVTVARASAGSSPFNSYAIMNIQSDLVLTSSAKLRGYAMLYAGGAQLRASALTIGVDGGSRGLFVLGDGATITIRYDADHATPIAGVPIGTSTFLFNGDVTFGSLRMEMMGNTIDTSNVTFAIPYNIQVEQQTGCFYIGGNAALLPGASVHVAEGASAVVTEGTKFYVADLFTPANEGNNEPTYPASLAEQRANLIVDGAFTVKSGATFAGVVQTNGTGKINVEDGATLSGSFTAGGGDKVTTYDLRARIGLPDSAEENLFFALEDIGASEYRAVSGAEVEDFDGNETASTKGVWTYDVTLRFDANGGTGTTAPVVGEIGAPITLPDSGFTREGYTFTVWNPDQLGNGAGYQPGDPITLYPNSATTLFAQWKLNTYTVTWKNEDGTVLETDYNVPYGTKPSYDGENPVKAADAQYTYTFDKWTPEIYDTTIVTQDVEYTAHYSNALNKYAVTVSAAAHGTASLSDNVVDGKAYYGVSVTFTAVPESEDFEFSTWTDESGAVVSTEASYTVTVTGDLALRANFKLAFAPVAKIEDQYFRTLNDAVSAAQSGDTIVVLADIVQSDNLTIPADVTLLLPYAKGIEDINGADANHPYANERISGNMSLITPVGEDVTFKLTLSGAKLTVCDGAKLVVGGTLSGYHPIAGGSYGPHSEINMVNGGSIDVLNGGILSDCGYITGGTINASGTVYEPFVVTDYHGGTVTFARAAAGSSPFNSYAFLNIQSDLVLNSDAKLYGYVMIFAGSGQNPANALAVGEGGMFHLANGSKLTISYDAADTQTVAGVPIGKSTFNFDGDVEFGGMIMQYSEYQLDTSGFTFAIPYNVAVNQRSGCFTLGSSAVVLPGSVITVAEGASAVVKSGKALYVADVFAPKKEGGKITYPTELADQRGSLIVNGTLTVENGATLGGVVQTNGSGKLVVEDGAILEGRFTSGGGDAVTTYDLQARIGLPDSAEENLLFALADLGASEYRAVSGAEVEDIDGNENASVNGVWTYDVTVSFNANAEDATGATAAAEGEIGKPITLPECGFTRTGYTFDGWNTMADGEGDSYAAGGAITLYPNSAATLFAQWKLNTYTITFVNEDNTELAVVTVNHGETPVYTGETPTKESDAEYTYTFTGWDPELAEATEDMTYTATYSATVNTYKVEWIVDGEVVETDEAVAYGTMPTFDGDTPTKDADAQFTYEFTGWSPVVSKVTGDAQYTATFTETLRSYTVKWVNEDGTELKTDTVNYGMVPVYEGANPTKEADAQYTYAFDGWTPEPVAVTGDVTYTAQYTATLNTYTVRWLNADGTELASDTVAYGETPAYTGQTPTKEADAQYTYTFNGWTPEITVVTGDAAYTATYTENVNTYTITWKNYDGTVLETDEAVAYGTMPTYDGETPTKEADAQYTYTFKAWDNEVTAVTGDATYTAVFESTVNTYTVVWKHEDGTVLETDENVPYGEIPTFDGDEPTKEQTDTTVYAFSGWNPEVKAVEDDAEYTAAFTESTRLYTVQWLNEDDTKLAEDQTEVAFDAELTFPGEETPTKEGDAQYSYTFNGWSRTVEGNVITMRATYTQTVNEYTITWIVDGEIVKTETVPYGTVPAFEGTPKKAATAEKTYTFAGWDKPLEAITGDVTFTALFTETVNQYTVTFDANGGAGEMPARTVDYGTDVLLTSAFNREGHIQMSWNTAADGSGTAYALTDTLSITEDITLYAQWAPDGWVADETGLRYYANGEVQTTGWTQIDGAWYYLDTETGYAATGVSRVPYAPETVGTYGPNEADLESYPEYAEAGYATKGEFVFDENGVFQIQQTGIYTKDDGSEWWCQNGEILWNAGLVQDGNGNYYYAEPGGGFYKSKSDLVTKTNDLLPAGVYTFDENGILQMYDGIVTLDDGKWYYENGRRTFKGLFQVGENGDYYYADEDGRIICSQAYAVTKTNDLLPEATYRFDDEGRMLFNGLYEYDGELWYYENGLKTPKGLVKIGDDYYYIKPNCAAVRGTDYYVSKTNGLMDRGVYSFANDGKMIIPEYTAKNGLIWENGSLWYYVDDVRTHAGLILVDGYYYYIKSNGQAVTNSSYFVSNTNNLMARATHTFDADGHMTDVPVVKDGLVFENGRYYYYVNDVKTHAGLIKIGEDYYYINSSCYAVTNCEYYVSNTNGLMAAGTYAFGADGKMIIPEPDTRTGIYEEDGELYYYENGVRTHAGLVQWEGHYYYIKSNCTAVRGMDYFVSNTNGLLPRGTYYFNEDGTMTE